MRDPSLTPVTGMLRWIKTAKRENEALFTSRSLLTRLAAAIRRWFSDYF
jgi:hypothetical protein